MSEALRRPAEQFDTRSQQHEASLFGTWAFLATELMFFGPLFLAYIYGRFHEGHAFALGSQHTHLWLGSLNTAILLTSSLAMALSVRAAEAGERRALTRWLLVTALLGVVFLLVKGLEYREEWNEGLVPVLQFAYEGPDEAGVEFFFLLYFLMTGVHALHLAIGIALVLWLAVCAKRARFESLYSTPVEAVGLYWHFVDALWVFLYPLLYLLERYSA